MSPLPEKQRGTSHKRSMNSYESPRGVHFLFACCSMLFLPSSAHFSTTSQGRDIVVFWGSQSGTAEGFANRLARECYHRFGRAALSADLSDYDPDTIGLIPESKLAVFVLSTFGEGDPSDNATTFWEWLRSDASSASRRLPNLRYVAFGLGNSSYKHYNRVVDAVVEALDNAGARRLMPVGKADDADGSTGEAFLAWKDQLHTLFVETLGYQELRVPYTPRISAVEDPSLSRADLHLGEPLERRSGPVVRGRNAGSPIRLLPIEEARPLCGSFETECLHVELDLAGHPELRYRTGDHLAVYPVNPDDEVRRLMRGIGVDERAAGTPLLIKSLEDDKREALKLGLPTPTTISALFRHYLDICAPVSRDTIRELAGFAPSQEARSMLSSLGGDKSAYAAFTAKNHVTFGRLLALTAPDAVWKDLPLSYLLETIQPLRPRYYSISSSSAISPRRVALTVAVERTPLPDDPSSVIPGLTSHFLLAQADSLNGTTRQPLTTVSAHAKYKTPPATFSTSRGNPDHRIFASVVRSPFKLPALTTTPLIMIAAGTGIAPFRAFILERSRLRAVGKPVGRMFLFFGCRRAEDWLYREELARVADELNGKLEIVVAFSRIDNGGGSSHISGREGGRRMYVQDRVRERGSEVCALLEESANLYVCGRAAMARDVGRVVEELMRRHKGWTEAEVQRWSQSAKKGNKWFEDVWG